MKKEKQLAKNMAAQVVSFVLSVLISFFLASFVVGKIGTDVYGFVGLANNITSYMAIFTVAINGLANRYITISYVKDDIKSANMYFTSVTAANLIVILAVFIPVVILIARLEHIINIPSGFENDVKLLWAFVFLMFAMQLAFGRCEVAVFAKNRLDLTAMKTAESNILKIILLTVLYCTLRPRILYVGISAFICAGYIVVWNIHYMKKLTPELKFDKKLVNFGAVGEILKNGIWNSAEHMSSLLFTGLDLLIANLFIGASGMGILSIAKTVPMHIMSFVAMIAGVFYPSMTVTYAKGDNDQFVSETSLALKICGAVCSVPLIGFVVFGKEFYGLWLPSLSAAELNEVQILSVLTILPQIFSMYIYPLYQVNTLTCKLKAPAIVNIALGALNIVLVFVLLKHTDLGLYAIAGVSSILLALRILLFIPMYAAAKLGRRLFEFYPAILRGILLNAVLLAVFSVVRRIILPQTVISFISAAGICGILGYAVCICILFRKEERKSLKNMIKKVK